MRQRLDMLPKFGLIPYADLILQEPKSIFPDIPLLESDASLLNLSSKGRCSIPVRNIETWEKRARKLIAINSHEDLFPSAAYLCLQQQTMSVQALSRLLEAVAKSIKHTTAMSMILAMKIFQARRDAALDTSKLLLENSSYELCNAPINSKTLFGNKIRKLPGAILRPSSKGSWHHPRLPLTYNKKVSNSAPLVFKRPKQPTKPARPKQMQSYRPKSQTQSYSSIKIDYAERSGNPKQFPSSKQASSSTKF